VEGFVEAALHRQEEIDRGKRGSSRNRIWPGFKVSYFVAQIAQAPILEWALRNARFFRRKIFGAKKFEDCAGDRLNCATLEVCASTDP
jgi:hypothetical protein